MVRKTIEDTIRGMVHMNTNGIREFVLNSLLSNTIVSKVHGHGLPHIVRNVRGMRFKGKIVYKKAWYKIHKISQIIFNK